MRGCALAVLFSVDRVRVMSHSLTVRSKDPEATQLRSVLQIQVSFMKIKGWLRPYLIVRQRT